MKFTLLMPVYKGSTTLCDALDSIHQAAIPEANIELLLLDDNPPDLIDEINNTIKILRKFNLNYQYFKSSHNLGYSAAIKFLYHKTNNESGVIVYFAQDDIMSKEYFRNLLDAYSNGANFTSRSFGMFNNFPNNIIREIPALNHKSFFKVSDLEPKKLRIFMFSLSQLSGLSFLRKEASLDIGDDTFTAHIYPIISVALKHKGKYFDDYQVLCRTESSQTTFKKKIYSPPPTLQWVNLIRTTFTDNPYGMKIMINDRARNYDGLYQIVQYSSRIACYHELLAMISTDPKILFNPMTYLWAFLILLPRKFIRWIGDLYKCYSLKKLLNSRNLKQNLEKFHIN
jgi:hypothetical protein